MWYTMTNIEINLKNLKKTIDYSKKNAYNQEVEIVCVTKNQTIESINKAIDLGIKNIGENKVQSFYEKIDDIKPVKCHLIGHLQTNKVKTAINFIDLIQSVDSIKLATEINKQSKIINKISDILIQVNIAQEETKFGINDYELHEILFAVSQMENIRVLGLMAIMPINTDINYYKKMYDLFQINKNHKYNNISMDILSMGMSNDFVQAVSCGANMIRIGSYIFK